MTQNEANDIPTEAEADQVVQNFIDAGCQASKALQKNGLWKVVALCPSPNE